MTRTYPDTPVVIGSHDDVVWKVLTEVAAERQKQVAIGHAPHIDDAYVERELAKAAAAYALNATGSATGSLFWPWPGHTWQPADPRRDLVRVAALAVAEIERIDRAAAKAALA